MVAEVETDKATMEVEAAEDGVIGKLLLAEGTEHVPVNHPIALLVTEGEATASVGARALRPSLRMRDLPRGARPAVSLTLRRREAPSRRATLSR